MKHARIAAAAAVLLAVCTSANAISYNGDVQLMAGLRFARMKAKHSTKVGSAAFDIGVNSYNLFELNDLIALGFVGGLDVYIGGCGKAKFDGYKTSDRGVAMGIELMMGPAISFSFIDAFKLQGSLGLAFGGDKTDAGNDIDVKMGNIGIVLDTQMKFMPNGKFSPLVGLRLARYKTNLGGDIEDWLDDGHCNEALFYGGIAFNFGA